MAIISRHLELQRRLRACWKRPGPMEQVVARLASCISDGALHEQVPVTVTRRALYSRWRASARPRRARRAASPLSEFKVTQPEDIKPTGNSTQTVLWGDRTSSWSLRRADHAQGLARAAVRTITIIRDRLVTVVKGNLHVHLGLSRTPTIRPR